MGTQQRRITSSILAGTAITLILAGILAALTPPLTIPSLPLSPIPPSPCPAPEITGNGTSILILPGCHAPGAP